MSPYQQDEPLTDVDDESVDDGEEADAIESLLPFWKRDMREL